MANFIQTSKITAPYMTVVEKVRVEGKDEVAGILFINDRYDEYISFKDLDDLILLQEALADLRQKWHKETK